MKRICLYLLIFSVFFYTGCYSSTAVDKNLLYSDYEKNAFDDLTIVTKEDERIIIQDVTYQIINDTLYANGINKSNVPVYNKPIEFKIALVDIKNIEIKEFDGLATAGCIIGSVGLVLLFIGVIAMANSFDKPAKKCQYEGWPPEPVE